ncbi:MAG: hypothetical protein ACLGHX_13090, partial [Acidimicrobiia bacterium]
MRRMWPVVLVVLTACAPTTPAAESTTTTTERPASTTPTTLPFPPAPVVPDGPLSEETVRVLDGLWAGLPDTVDTDAIRRLGQSGDARVAWLIADLLRFAGAGEILTASTQALRPLTGVEFSGIATWVSVTDHLIAWDTPAPPGYLDYKRRLFTLID